jgi:DNA-3-methyladenine glycosylase I
VAFFVLNFTLSGTPRKRELAAQARAMLAAGLAGVPPKAQLRMQVRPGDRVIAYVGAPEKSFVGDAVVELGYHRFSEDESARFPAWLGYGHGITLVDVRTWSRAVPLMSVWPHTVGARTNPQALWFGGIVKLAPDDGWAILAAGVGGSIEATSSDGERRPSTTAAVQGRPASSEPSKAPVLSAREPVTVPALRSPNVRSSARGDRGDPVPSGGRCVLPKAIAHADWGTAEAKRVVATAELDTGGAYVAHKARVVGMHGPLSERMGVTGTPSATLLGFDFPIGVPRAYAARAAIGNFASWMRGLDIDAPLFSVADEIGEVSIVRPFFPRNVTQRSPGLKEQFRAALGLTASESLRSCDAAHPDRGAASEMFWTLGPKAVGKATLAGWRDAIKPALADHRRRHAIWPFDGALFELLSAFDVVIVETYPAEFYRRLGLRIGILGHSKTSQEARLAAAPALLAWCSEHGVVPDDELVGQILDGFGPGSHGEDPFDAVVGLLGMIATVRSAREPDLPNEDAVRHIEGWMFGQPAPSQLPFKAIAAHDATRTHAEPPMSRLPIRATEPPRADPPGGGSTRVDAAQLAGIVVGPDGAARCWWAETSPQARRYHDIEWGVPTDHDWLLFDQLSFQVIQGGFSWDMVLGKREGIRRAFAHFDFEQVAQFNESDVERLLADPGIVRSRQKIEAVIHNARRAVMLASEEGSFAQYLWRFEPTAPNHAWDRARMENETSRPESRALARDLKRRGWRLVGPYSMYLFMQAAGLVNSHLDGCDRRQEVAAARADFTPP